MPTDRPPTSASATAETGEARGPLFVDANVFLRYLTDDVPEQADRVQAPSPGPRCSRRTA